MLRLVFELANSNRESAFGLIAPSERISWLRSEAVRRIQKDFPGCDWNNNLGKAARIRLISLSWREMGEWIRKALNEETNERTKLYMEEVITVVDEIDPRFESKPECIAVDGLSSALRDLCRLVVSLRARLYEEGLDVGKVTSGDQQGLYYGFGFSPQPGDQLWFGLWIGPWAKEKVSPLWLQTKPESQKATIERLRSKPGAAFFNNSFWIVPLMIEGQTWDEVREKVTSKLFDLIGLSKEKR